MLMIDIMIDIMGRGLPQGSSECALRGQRSRSPSLLGVEAVAETLAFQRWSIRRAKCSS